MSECHTWKEMIYIYYLSHDSTYICHLHRPCISEDTNFVFVLYHFRSLDSNKTTVVLWNCGIVN